LSSGFVFYTNDFSTAPRRSRQPLFLLGPLLYIDVMLWRPSRGRSLNAPAAFIRPCQPIVCQALNSKHDGYQKYFSPVGGTIGSPGSPLNKRLGHSHNSGQLPAVLLVLRPVGCLSLVGEYRFRELLRMCRNWL